MSEELSPQELADFTAAAEADMAGTKTNTPEAKKPKEETAEDASAEVEQASDETPSTDEGEAEPEPLELERATAALRRAGFDDEDLKTMSRSRILKRGLHLAKVQSDWDSAYSERDALRAKVKEQETTPKADKQTPAQPEDIDFPLLQKTLALEHGEEAAAALVDVLKRNKGEAAQAKELVQQFLIAQQVDGYRRDLVKSFPEAEQPETWTDVYELAQSIERRNDKLTPAQCLEQAALKLKLKTKAEVDRSSNADKNGAKRNGSSESSGKKIPAKKLTRDDAEYAAWERRMSGASLDDVEKILNGSP